MKNKNLILGGLVVIIIILIIALIGTYFFGFYDVIFDSKGGTSVAAERVQKGKVVAEPPTPVLEGYIFTGWYLGDTLYDFSSPINEDITLTGSWKSILVE